MSNENKVCPFCGSDKIENHRYNTDDKGLIWYDHFVCLTCGKEGFEPSDRKRKTNEDIVPPFELCKCLPEGSFADSVLVHVVKPGSGTEVRERIKADTLPLSWTKVPAPTLPEIMLALDEAGYFSPTCYRKANTWCVDCQDDPIDEETSFQPCLYDAEDDYNPATAAMKLWLEMEAGK